MIPGTVYGVVLNDSDERTRLGTALSEKPYGAPPLAPVVYIKPRACVTTGSAPVPLSSDLDQVVASATVLLLFGDRPGMPVAAALALDVSVPHPDYYRPAIRQRCRDGFLPIGAFAAYDAAALAQAEIVTLVDADVSHRWSLGRLVRPIERLIADLTSFMTLADGDALMIGLAGDAPLVAIGRSVRMEGGGLPPLTTRFVAEVAA